MGLFDMFTGSGDNGTDLGEPRQYFEGSAGGGGAAPAASDATTDGGTEDSDVGAKSTEEPQKPGDDKQEEEFTIDDYERDGLRTSVYRDKNNKYGNGITKFGSFTRFVDQKTGKESWLDYNLAGENPRSVVAARILGSGRRLPADFWTRKDYAEAEGESSKALDYTQRAIEFNRQAERDKVRRRAQFDASVGDQFATALDALGGESAVIKEGKDGRRWKMGYVNRGALAKANELISERGGRDSLSSVIAYQRVDKFGKPVGDVQFALAYVKDGNVRDGGQKYFRRFSMGDAARIMANAQQRLGQDEYSARSYAVNALRGANPFNWEVNANDGLAAEERQAVRNLLRNEQKRNDEMRLAAARQAGAEEATRKLTEAAKRNAASSVQAGGGIKETLAALTEIGSRLYDRDGNVRSDIDDGMRASLMEAYNTTLRRFMEQTRGGQPVQSAQAGGQQAGGPAPTVQKDGKLVLPNGTMLGKGDVYTNPADGRRYRWLGGDAMNWEIVDEPGVGAGRIVTK